MKLLEELDPESFSRLTLPPQPARAGWTFDREAILSVMDEGLPLRFQPLENPIEIKFTGGRYTYGTHTVPTLISPEHSITISQNYSMDSANITLWHELVHAFQSEAWARAQTEYELSQFYRRGYKPARGPHGASYMENSYEVEARQLATYFSLDRKLLKGG